ncbi:MAG: DUF177 domain-containing protein [Thermovirgaceae bacterium]|nr:DUF177 domain-containing protein [Thermovirgaceae bacterium]
MAGGEKRRLFLEKPQQWRCPFDGAKVIESDASVDLFWMLPINGDIEYWGQVYSFMEEVTVKANVFGDRSGLTVDLNISASATAPCARCLSMAPLEIFRDFRYFYKSLSITESGDDKDKDEDLIFVQSIDEEVDISDQVWESLVVSLPEKVLCSAECCGICQFCGHDRNKGDCGCSGEGVDPRFEVLAGQEQIVGENVPGKGGNQRGSSKK